MKDNPDTHTNTRTHRETDTRARAQTHTHTHTRPHTHTKTTTTKTDEKRRKNVSHFFSFHLFRKQGAMAVKKSGQAKEETKVFTKHT